MNPRTFTDGDVTWEVRKDGSVWWSHEKWCPDPVRSNMELTDLEEARGLYEVEAGHSET